MMQAFDYRHLVPAEKLLVAVTKGRWRAGALELVEFGPVKVPAGGAAKVYIKTPGPIMINKVEAELRDPPKGVTLGEVEVVPGQVAFAVKVDGQVLRPGYADNLIVEGFTEMPGGLAADGKTPKPARRVSLGILPAVALRVVAK